MKHTCVSNTTPDIQMDAECSIACVYHNFHVCMDVDKTLWEGIQMVKLSIDLQRETGGVGKQGSGQEATGLEEHGTGKRDGKEGGRRKTTKSKYV